MGMAASQARFLGLTARKSNVEYQGQQVNQQRTALANESANLYNQMMGLNVPTPPSTNDFYKTTYELEDSTDSYAKENYTFESVAKTYSNENEYNITLVSKTEKVQEVPYTYKTGTSGTDKTTTTSAAKLITDEKYGQKYYQQKVEGSAKDEDNRTTNYIVASSDSELGKLDTSKYTLSVYNGGFVKAVDKEDDTKISYYKIIDGSIANPSADELGQLDNENLTKIVSSKYSVPQSQNTHDVITKIITHGGTESTLTYDENNVDAYSDNGVLAVNPYQIYKVNPDKKLSGKQECCNGTNGDGYYFYQDTKGKNHFFTADELNNILTQESNKDFNESYANTYNQEVQHQITGILEKSSTGRFSSIKVYNDSEYPEELRGKTFALNVKNVFDQDGYDNAMNDYTFQKDVYEKAISDINAKTEVIQKQDQNLELRLNQLNTEQNAIKTEMEAVDKVISDNVEKTFNTFG